MKRTRPKSKRFVIGHFVPSVVLGVLAATMICWNAVNAWSAWQAHAVIRQLSAIEGMDDEHASHSLQKLIHWMDRQPHPFGGTPDGWDAEAKVFLLSADLAGPQTDIGRALLERTELAAHDALKLRPVDHGAWSRIAVASLLLKGAPGPETFNALRNARLSAPYRPELAAWRLDFAVTIWSGLPRDLREAELLDADLVDKFNPGGIKAALADADLDARSALLARFPQFETTGKG